MKKLSEDHYIVVDNSEIKIGDIVAEKLLTGKYELFTIHTLNDIDKSTQKKITHSTQPESLGMGWMQSVQPLLLSGVKEVLGIVDVEKTAHNWSTRQTTRSTDYWRSMVSTYVEAYNQALEDNKEKKYTEEDLMKFYKYVKTHTVTEALRHIQPKTEWEVEFVDGKLQLVKE